MNKAIFYISLMFICGCLPPEEPDPSPLQTNCSIELEIFECLSSQCIDGVGLENIVVRVYTNYNDASNEQNAILVDSTNSNGWLKFYDLNCNIEPIVRVNLGENGTYIGYVNFFTPSVRMDIPIIENTIYDFGSWATPVQPNISLQYPAVGQYSRYRYFQNNQGDDYNVSNDYLSNTELQIYISDRLDENTYRVGENMNNINNTNYSNYSSYQEAIWRIEDDSIYVSGTEENYSQVSFLWNIYGLNSDTEHAFPINTNSEEFLDMEGPVITPTPEWTGIGTCSDLMIEGQLFENLLVNKVNEIETADRLSYTIYNHKDGVVRSMKFSSSQMSGLDLIIE